MDAGPSSALLSADTWELKLEILPATSASCSFGEFHKAAFQFSAVSSVIAVIEPWPCRDLPVF